MANWLTQLFGSRNQRLLHGYSRIVDKTSALEESFRALSDEQLQAKTAEFRQLLAQGKTLDDIAPQAFAATREAARVSSGDWPLLITPTVRPRKR